MLIELADDAFGAGLVHGRTCGEDIRFFLGDRLARINALRARPLDRELALSIARRHGQEVEAWAPELAQEIRGLAQGAGIDYDDALLLQYRRELVGWTSGEAHGCSLAAWRPELATPRLAQTIDLDGDVASLVRVFLTRAGASGRPRVLMAGLAGLIGYMGVNDRGLAVGINMVLSTDWQPGISPYLLVRHVLGCDTLDQAVGELRRLPRSSSRSLTLLQGRRCVNVEMTGERLSAVEALPMLHTNHFTHAGLTPLDAMNPISRNSSRQRLSRLEALLDRLGAPESPEQMLDALADHSMFPVGICMHAQGHVTRADTVAAVVLEPAEGRLHLRRGHPCTAATRIFSL